MDFAKSVEQNMEVEIARFEMEHKQEWRKWTEQIPSVKFSSAWDVKITPPFAGAMARFQVRHKKAFVSVYLDCHNALGYMDGPYWEVYPVGGDTERFMMDDTEGLMKSVRKSIRQQNRKKSNEKE